MKEFCKQGYDPNEMRCSKTRPPGNDCAIGVDIDCCKAWTLEIHGKIPELIVPDEEPEPEFEEIDVHNYLIDIADRISTLERTSYKLFREFKSYNDNLLKIVNQKPEETKE